MKQIYLFILSNLIIIHKGAALSKLKSVLYLAVMTSPFAYLVEHFIGWYFKNYGYVAFVFTAILFDHFLGTWVHAWIKRDFSLKKNIYGLFTKISLTIGVGVLIEGMSHIMGSKNFLTDYFSLICRVMVFVYPAGSALMNSAIITKGSFPPVGFINKLKKFNKNLDLSEFKEKNDDDKNISDYE